MLALASPAPNHLNLPDLVREAAAKLASAATSAEVLDARDQASVAYDAAKSAGRIAKAKRAHDEVITAVYRAQADALEIEALAKRRLADEYDAAQDRGEVRAANTGRSVSALETPSFTDIGLTGKEIHEARQIRDAEQADPGIVRRVLDERIEAGQEPTKTALREAVLEAARETAGGDRADRRNPHYVSDPSYTTLLAILGPSRALMENIERGDIDFAVAANGFLDAEHRVRAVRDITKARDFLTRFLETIDAE